MKININEEIKYFFRTTLPIIVVVGVSIAIFKNCNNTPVENKTIHKSEKALVEDIKKLNEVNTGIDKNITAREARMMLDSVILSIQVNKYKLAYFKAIKTAPDTCQSYIVEIYKGCEKVDSSRVSYSLKQDSTIKDLKAQKLNLQNISFKKDTIIAIKNDSIKTVKALLRPRFWKGFKTGFVAGAITTQALNTGAKLLTK